MDLMIITVNSEQEMKDLGARLGALLKGGEVIELVGDVGVGKTTLTKGIAVGLMVDDDIQSPSFTISRVYPARADLRMAHYDFYRLNDAGILADELHETALDSSTITIIEWGKVVEGVLPSDRLTIKINSPSENSRVLNFEHSGPNSCKLEQLI
jgi:tRNA threonylcarbamoyladenosine biosynthesis protein TsaE